MYATEDCYQHAQMTIQRLLQITKSFMNPANSQALEATIRHVFFPHLDLLRVSLEFFN